MVRHTRRNTAFVIFGIVIVGASIFFLTLPVGEINVNLAPPLQLTDAGFVPISLPIGETLVEATGINCKVKQNTLVYGINNRQLDSLDSSGIQGSPFIRLGFIQGTDIEVVAYNVNPKIFCSDQGGLPIEVAIRDMQLTVRANYLTVTNAVLETQQVFGSRLLSFGQGQGEQTLISFPVQVSQLESQLPNQNFPISLTFEITGKINVFYRDFPSLIYQIPIFRADLETFHTIDIRKQSELFVVTITCPTGQEDVDPSPDSILCKPIDTDKDGYPDITDSCPFLAENFNGFEDLDGCPDTAPTLITCSDGSIVSSTTLCPAPPVITCELQDDRNCTRALCEADGGVFIEERNIFNQVTGTYCQIDLVKPKCEPDEKLELTTGNVFICVPDPALLDTDGDGILDGIDACPTQFGLAEFNGCPEGVIQPPPIGTLEELILSGDVLTFIEVVFTDGTTESTLGSLKSGSIDTTTFSQRFGTIIPLEVTGSITGDAGKPISEINYLVFFDLPNPQGVFLTSSNLSHIVTVIESSVSKRNGNVIELTGETTGSSIIIGNLEGWILGEGMVTASEISQIARPLIPEGQSRDADVTIGYDGRFTFNRDTDTQTFVISISEIKFFDFQITSEVIPKVPINCEKQGLLPVKNEFGVVIGCKKPDPNDPDILACNSNERTSFLCDGQFRADNCNGTTICIEPDDDGDGFSNWRDGCINDPEDGLAPNPTDGCPQDRPEDPPTPPCPVGQICKPPNSVEPPDDPVCSERNPDACIIPPEQFTLLLIVIGLVLIAIGIAVALSRRRARVFG